ncbi:hypothetical protein AAKU64_001443 [Undibacterium sp. GrIS 1.8]|uniref:hypothetical protein n=1 Tax=unclassified Undibacterium TaxID=2630295 RepID=UPI0033946EDD
MKFLLIVIFSFISFDALAEENCKFGDGKTLLQTWNSFIRISLKGEPEEIAMFYKFPVKLYSPTDSRGIDEKPIVLKKNIFLKNYKSIFQEDESGQEINLFQEIKKLKTRDYTNKNAFDEKGCSQLASVRVEDYVFVWSKSKGWLVESATYIGYQDLKTRFEKKDVIQ